MADDEWFRKPCLNIGLDVWCPEWYRKSLRGLDVKKIVDCWSRAGVQACTWPGFPKDHFGICFYPTEVGPRHRALGERDILREFVEELHNAGIKAFGYYSVGYDNHAAEKNPDWRQKTVGGEYAVTAGKWKYCCINGPYREYVLAHVREQVENYDIDGMFIDIIRFSYEDIACYCDYCRRKFRERFRADIPRKTDWNDPLFRDFLRWRYGCVNDFLRELRTLVKSINPDFVMTHNYYPHRNRPWRYGQNPEEAARYDDVVGAESHWITRPGRATFGGVASDYARDLGEIWRTGEMAKVLRATGNGKPVWVYIPRQIYTADYQCITPIELKLAVSDIIANGGSPCLIDYTLPDGSPDAFFSEKVLPEVYSPELSRKIRLMDGAEPVKFAALHYSPSTRDFYDRDGMEHRLCFRGAYKALLEGHIPFEVVTDQHIKEENLRGYRLLILPNVACMSRGQVEEIESYVRDGGGLVATFKTSLFDEEGVPREDFGLREVLGASYRKPVNYSISFIKPGRHAVSEGIDRREVIRHMGCQLAVDPLEGSDVAGHVALPATEVREDVGRWFTHPPDYPPGETTDHPATLINKFGEGMTCYFSGKIAYMYGVWGNPAYRKMLLNAIKTVSKGNPPLEVEAPMSVEATMFRRKERILVHLVNFTACNMRLLQNVGGPVLEEIVPVNGVKLGVDASLLEKANKAYLAPGGTELKYEEKNGRVTVTIPQVEIHETVVFE